MIIPVVAIVIRIFWISLELPYLCRFRVRRPAQDWDKRSRLVWNAAHGLELIGMALGLLGYGAIQTLPRLIGISGLLLLVAGCIIRGIAIKTLGSFFTNTVVIKDDHQLIRTGLYKYVRHPAYTGTLLAHLGLGLSFSNWWALGLSTLPYLIAAFYRMHVEEKALRQTFGTQYNDYATSAKRLVPGLY